MGTIDFKAEAAALRDELIARRRDFHQHPETAFEEVRTAGIVARELNALGLEVQTGIGKTGVVGILEGDEDGPTVLVRADMDALPIMEENDVDYASTVAGKMHACGHDGHTAMALGVAKIFSKHRDKLSGRVKFVFQPAEEIGAGARAMIADGVLEGPRPDVSLGLHLWNDIPLGQVGVADGPIMAAPSIFEIEIIGRGGHGAMPEQTVDPVVCAAQIVMALQTIVARNASPLDTAVVSVTTVKAGDALNVIPSQATVAGTFRTFTDDVLKLVDQRIHEIATNTAIAMGCTAKVHTAHQAQPVVNDPQVGARVRDAFRKLGMNEENFLLNERTMAAEDMGYLMNEVPGMFFFVGSANAERGLDYTHHHPRFDFDEEALPLGVALLSAAAAEYLLKEES